MSQQRIAQLKTAFNLQAHPEGGYYAEQYRADTTVNSPVDGMPRSSMSHIYFLLTKGDVSRWHKVLHDEIWNVYEGAPLRILSLRGQTLTDEVIGNPAPNPAPNSGEELDNNKLEPGLEYFKIIEGGDYQAAESTGEYTFVGCTVAPGFEFTDFSYIEDDATKTIVEGKKRDYAKFL
ncbi:cupin domain-containing protein [Glaciecola siphonariae]|uniref:Cupin domain-containing protein n=1 Tax=Glaciecola siphonariae TaxID=521012 RepID=A0ABV9LZ22_9ALTE